MNLTKLATWVLLATLTGAAAAGNWPQSNHEQAICASDQLDACTAQAIESVSPVQQRAATAALAVCATADDYGRSGFETGETASASASLWSDPATWGGVVPTTGASVLIPAGRRVVLDITTPVLHTLTVEGELLAAQQLDVGIQVNTMHVRGATARFAIGCASQRYLRRATLTFFGSNRLLSLSGMGNKGLVVFGGARLHLFGADRLSWTKLAANVAAGATAINVVDTPSGWRAGDQLIIAPSGLDADEYDRVSISSVTNNQVQLSSALAFAHWGSLQNYGGKVLDERAPVGLLTRNIVLRSAGDADQLKFGGHVMIMADSSASIDGVQLHGMGQAGLPGRYPVHWHLAGNRNGDFVRNSSVTHSFQRAMVLHGTNQVLLEGNVAFDVHNHAFVWAEDGNEANNRLVRNLGVFVQSPDEADFAFPVDNQLLGNTSQAEFRSATFWGRSFNHIIIGNHAAGSVNGMGFFFDRFSGGLNADEGVGLVFQDNIANSHYRPGANGVAGEIYPEATMGHGLMITSNIQANTEHVFERYTGYKNYAGAWLEDRRVRLQDSILADNGSGVVMLRSKMDRNVIVGQSANTIGGTPPFVGGFGLGTSGGVHLPSSHGGVRAPIISNTQVINQRSAALTFDVDEVGDGSLVTNLTIANTPQRLLFQESQGFEFGYTTMPFDDPTGAARDGTTPTRWLKRRSPSVTPNCQSKMIEYVFACNPADSIIVSWNEAPSRWTYLVDADGAVQGIGQPWYFDAAIAHLNLGELKNGGVYQVVEDANGARQQELELRDMAGKSVELSFRAAGPASFLSQNGSAVVSFGSLAALRNQPSSGHYFDAGAERLYIKMAASAGAASTQRFVVSAPFLTDLSIGARAPVSVSNLVSGVRVANHNNEPERLRLRVPPATADSPINVSNLTRSSIASALPSTAGTVVFRGYVQAPQSGIYRFSLPAAGGNTDLYIGDTWVTGSLGNTYTVVNDPSPDSSYESALFSLQAGWHPITVVYARDAEQIGFERGLWLRWSLPGGGDYSYIPVWRNP